MRWPGLAFALLVLLVAPTAAQAQDAPPETINLFFDCNMPACDPDFMRREVPFINWMRDRADADVHVLVTSQATGGGGRLFTLVFLGLRSFLGDDQGLTYASAADATVDEQRNGLAARLRLGLVHYVQGTAAADRLTVIYTPDAAAPAAAEPDADQGQAPSAQDDPWNYWTFNINASANANGEATAKFSNTSGRLAASRVTEAWKIDFGVNVFRRVQEFEYSIGGVPTTVKETQDDWRANGLIVRSVGDQWALGMRANASSTTRTNQKLRLALESGLEFNLFPYEESSRRSLAFQYLIGPSFYEYDERTIFDQTEETLLQHSLGGGLSLNQPWGRWSTSLTAAQYLHDPERWSVTVFGNINIRLFRGFSVNGFANYQWLRDQLYLSAGGATEEQILLRQRQLETSFFYSYSIGIQYRFGSIFNNVVNPRFGGPGAGDVIIFN